MVAPVLPQVRWEEYQLEPGELGTISRGPPRMGVDEYTAMGYVRNILDSKVYDVAVESPLDEAPRLGTTLGGGNKVMLKREDLQPVFSFKLRGAYNCMAQLTREELDRGVICSSAGNHAQGVALAAGRLDCDAVIAMPETTPRIKVESVERLGATVALVGDTYDACQAYAKQRSVDEGRTFIPPFDHPMTIAGQGTVGMEILRQHPGPLEAIFVPIGGGGLIAGIAQYVKWVRPEVKVIGVEPARSNSMAQSLRKGERVELTNVDGFADGVAVKVVGEECFRICRDLVDGVVLVDTAAICAAIKDVFLDTRSVLEPAGAVAVAGAKAYIEHYGIEGASCVAVTSGANMNFDRLRIVSEIADVGLRREAVFVTSIPERPGSFKDFCGCIGSLNITEFKYRQNDTGPANVLYSVSLADDEREAELATLHRRMEEASFPTSDLSDDELTQQFLRQFAGGRAQVSDEVLFRVQFPERPGALGSFLDGVSPRWNISLFYYRSSGTQSADVLIGFQVPSADRAAFEEALEGVGYPYTDQTDNAAFAALCRGAMAPAETPDQE